ncbi:MAG: alpha/beta hydrolase [Deltaproteobacteria bacterium]|nr:alpha/beta hydrolase [Deltaproteobacteria bacterium]
MVQTLKYAQTPRLKIAYEEQGNMKALPVILVHGFPDDVRTWDGVIGELVDSGYRTIAPYLRGFGPTQFLDKETPRSGQLTALGQDVIDFANALEIEQYILVGHDWGARAGYIVAEIQPERTLGLVAISVGYGTNNPNQVISFAQARAYWYQWYFALEHGRIALETDRRGFCRKLWETWSPGWHFDDATFEKTAKSFENPDFVDVAIHSYRHRWGNASSDPYYSGLETVVADLPPITVPTTVIHGADDGATHPETSANKERYFTNTYMRHVVPNVGHFVQCERPDFVIKAILELVAR